MTPELHVLLRHEIPPLLAAQVRSFGRIQWPGINTSLELWNHVPEPNPSLHFLVADGELLVAHASVRTRPVTHGGVTYRVAGLSTVFTYPDYRGRGLGERVVRAATEHVCSSDADLAMLFCGDRVKPLYERLGWIHLPTARITYGTPPLLKSDNHVLFLFLSDRGHAARRTFESETVHVGPSTW